MTTSNILEQANQRATAASHEMKVSQQQVIDQLRQDIGPAAYEQAKRQLPELERVIQTTLLPFVAQIEAIARKANCSFPQPIYHLLVSIQNLCVVAPQQLRQGITDYEQLTFQQIAYRGGPAVDVNVRPGVVASIKMRLRSYDLLNHMETQKAQVEQFINESGWPSMQPGPATMTTEPQREAAEVTVET